MEKQNFPKISQFFLKLFLVAISYMQIYIAIRNQKTCKIQLNGATEKKGKKIKKHF
jgi:hypothetical protein